MQSKIMAAAYKTRSPTLAHAEYILKWVLPSHQFNCLSSDTQDISYNCLILRAGGEGAESPSI